MQFVIHRVNTIHELRAVPTEYGCEIDIRANGSDLILNHEPFVGGDKLHDYMNEYQHGLLVLNIKEAGIEDAALRVVRENSDCDHFLLDVEFPYIYRASRQGERAIAMRYSEDEAIETVLNYKGTVDWVWIDTNTRLPLDANSVRQLQGFNTCLVCPSRWNRSEQISTYKEMMSRLQFSPEAVMTSLELVEEWAS